MHAKTHQIHFSYSETVTDHKAILRRIDIVYISKGQQPYSDENVSPWPHFVIYT